MVTSRSRRLAVVVLLAGLTAVLAPATSASASKSLFFEETAAAFWAVPHECADGSTVEATLLVQSTRDFESPDTEDATPSARVQYLAVCPDGRSFSWGAFLPATITSANKLKSVSVSGSGTVTDILGQTHQVSFDVTWTAVGPLVTTVNGPGSKRQQREATATGRVTFDGDVLVDGPSNHPTRPAPFIRIDTEK
jgi:hypothetical protein